MRKAAGSASTTIGVNIQNPHWFSWYNITSPSNYGYCPNKTPYNNSWSARNTGYTSNNTAVNDKVEKTIYDPCPTGYTVPPFNAFSTFTASNFPYETGGRYSTVVPGLWFPAVGHRSHDAGNLTDVGTYGRYSASVPYNTTAPRYMSFRDSNFGDDMASAFTHNRAAGQSIRPVAEKD